MARLLTLDAALATCSAGLVQDGVCVAALRDPAGAHALPELVERLLAEHGRGFDRVAVTVGPGSFTGLRAALSLAHGLALAAGVPIDGVTLGAAFAHRTPAGRTLWTATDSKRGRIYLERDGAVASVPLDALPRPTGPVAVAGDAAIPLAARLAARDADVQLLDARWPEPLDIALAVLRGDTRPPLPLYVDPPAARPGPPGRPPPA